MNPILIATFDIDPLNNAMPNTKDMEGFRVGGTITNNQRGSDREREQRTVFERCQIIQYGIHKSNRKTKV